MNMKIKLDENVSIDLESQGVKTILVTGETGTGKSTLVEDIYSQLKSNFTPKELSFLILDMTRVEFIDWKKDQYLLLPVIYKPQDAFEAFETALNSHDKHKLTVIHIEECDMVIEDQERFEQLWNRASNTDNVLVVFSTSRPAKNVLTNDILKDADLKIAFKLSTAEQSKRVLGFEGAEKLDQKNKIIITKNRLVSVGLLKLPTTSKTFSDLHVTPDIKIEILPTDFLLQTANVLELGDRLIGVFRGVGGSFIVKSLQDEFAESFSSYVKQNGFSISKALLTAIHAHNVSHLNFLGNPESAPESGVMILVVYIDQNNQLTLAQVGDITLKQRQDGRYVALTEDHTFDNQKEIARLVTFLKHSGNTTNSEDIINTIAIDVGFAEKVPSRFIGHPNWCAWGGEYGETIINTQPFVMTFSSKTDS